MSSLSPKLNAATPEIDKLEMMPTLINGMALRPFAIAMIIALINVAFEARRVNEAVGAFYACHARWAIYHYGIGNAAEEKNVAQVKMPNAILNVGCPYAAAPLSIFSR